MLWILFPFPSVPWAAFPVRHLAVSKKGFQVHIIEWCSKVSLCVVPLRRCSGKKRLFFDRMHMSVPTRVIAIRYLRNQMANEPHLSRILDTGQA